MPNFIMQIPFKLKNLILINCTKQVEKINIKFNHLHLKNQKSKLKKTQLLFPKKLVEINKLNKKKIFKNLKSTIIKPGTSDAFL